MVKEETQLTISLKEEMAKVGLDPRQVDLFNEFEAGIFNNLPPGQVPCKHIFTPGLYIREVFMFAGTVLTSRIHKYEHPYVISQGSGKVWTPYEGWQDFRAPKTGITKPFTRRILMIEEDTIWTTFHVRKKEKETVDEIEKDIIFTYINPIILDIIKSQESLKKGFNLQDICQ